MIVVPTRLARMALLTFCVLACAQAIAGWNVSESLAGLPVLCPFRRLTGHACPGCGMGRALALLAGGALRASVHQHPFALPLVLWTAISAVVPSHVLATRQRHASSMLEVGAYLATAALLVWWVL